MRIRREGISLVVFEPEGDFEYEWLVLVAESAPYQWIGRNLAVDTRSAGDLCQAVASAGWEYEVI
jgi:hypothetical protein